MGSLVQVVNWANGTTLAGLALARATGCGVRRCEGFYEASGYRHRYPLAGAFTIGSVVLTRHPLPAGVWQHELGHVRQYAFCGPMFLPLYGLAAGWSWLRCGDWWSRNVFEQRAGLAAGGYTENPVRRFGKRRRGGPAAASAVA